MTPWAPVVIRLAVVVLPGADDALTLGSTTLREQLDIDVMEGLKNRALGEKQTTEVETVARGNAETLGPVHVRRVVAKQCDRLLISRRSKGGRYLSKGDSDETAINVLDPASELQLRVVALEGALLQAALDGMPSPVMTAVGEMV